MGNGTRGVNSNHFFAECSIGPVKLEVVIDDILAVKVDAIVNGLNSNCELQGKRLFVISN